jgi:hypothetical protein
MPLSADAINSIMGPDPNAPEPKPATQPGTVAYYDTHAFNQPEGAGRRTPTHNSRAVAAYKRALPATKARDESGP